MPDAGAQRTGYAPQSGIRVNVTDSYSVENMRRTRPEISRPEDFWSFWDASIALLARQPLEIQLRHACALGDGRTLCWFSYRSLEGVSIVGYLLRWDDAKARPLVVHAHGYVGQCEVMGDWAARGINVMGIDVRGFGRSAGAVKNRSPYGLILTGIESPTTSVMRGAVCDFVRARDAATSLLAAEPSRTIFYGKSFGGALATMAAAVAEPPDLLLTGVPTLGWLDGRRRLVQGGSGREVNNYLNAHTHESDHVLRVLRYFDTMNFAEKVRSPTLVGVGLRDDIVPAPTVYAIINHLSCPHEVREFPVSHSRAPEESLWSDFESECAELSRLGASADFGRAHSWAHA